MKIGYDGKRAVRNMTGLGNYSRLVIESVGREYPDDRLIIYTSEMRENSRLNNIRKLENVEFRLPENSEKRFGASVWRTWGITRRLQNDDIDLYHGLSNELPLNIRKSGVPSVVTIHDLIYRRLPYCYTAIDRRIYDFKYGESCRNADRIIAVSECTKRDIMELYGIDEEKIDVVYQGCDNSFRRHLGDEELNAIRNKYDLPSRFVLQVGTIERRKNAELSVRALAAIATDVKLVLVGKGGKYLEEIMRIAEQERVADRILHLANVPFTDLPGINQSAEVIVYPSRYEGFGIPVLEGLASRRPVIAAKGSCLEEAGGEKSIYVAPDDTKAMTDALNAVIRKEIDLSEMIACGERHSLKFDNDSVAQNLHEVYEKTIRKSC